MLFSAADAFPAPLWSMEAMARKVRAVLKTVGAYFAGPFACHILTYWLSVTSWTALSRP